MQLQQNVFLKKKKITFSSTSDSVKFLQYINNSNYAHIRLAFLHAGI